MNTLNTLPTNLRNFALIGLTCSSILLTGCLEEAQELADSVAAGETVIGSGSLTSEGSGDGTSTISGEGSASATGDGEGTVSVSGEGTGTVTDPEPPQPPATSGVERLRTTVYAEYTFINDPTILEETLDLTQADIDIINGSAELNAYLPDSFIQCIGGEDNFFVCIRTFPDNLVVLKGFEVFENNRGEGIFEVCPPEIDLETCVDNLVESVDGTMVVSLGTPLAAATGNTTRMQTQGGAYMQYLKQGDAGTANTLADDYDMEAISSTLRAAINAK